MSKWMVSACLLALAVGPAGAADVRLDSYRNPKSEAFRTFNRLYLDGVRAGLISYNLWTKRRGGQPAFCVPEDQPMTSDQTEEIMLKSAAKRGARDDMLVALLLLSGLQEAYPCEKIDAR